MTMPTKCRSRFAFATTAALRLSVAAPAADIAPASLGRARTLLPEAVESGKTAGGIHLVSLGGEAVWPTNCSELSMEA